MKAFVNFLTKKGIHWLLLVIFFVIHNYKIYYGLVSLKTALSVFIILAAAFAVLYVIVFAITKDQQRASLILVWAGCIYLFFGNMHDLVSGMGGLKFFSRYVVFLPLLIIAGIVLIIFSFRKLNIDRVSFYINTLLIVFILIDIADLGIRSTGLSQKNLLSLNTQKTFPLPQAETKPDVYYILLDSYPSGEFLLTKMGHDNSAFDSSLRATGFKILQSGSNYNKTPFSMSSVMNFDYLNIDSRKPLNSLTYTNAMQTTKLAAVPRIFKQQGYTFSNFSIFDFKDDPSFHKINFLSLPEKRTLLYNTFRERFKKDLSWNFKKNAAADNDLLQLAVGQKLYNKRVIDSLFEIPGIRSGKPRFVYAHLMMPHAPFFYDENGKETSTELVLTEQHLVDKKHIISYLKYTNRIILQIVNKINKESNGQAVIILQSDHGFPTFLGSAKERESYYMNFTAIHLPGGDNKPLPDSITMINTFPVIFNHFFKAHIPLLKDSTIFLDFKEKS
jgi:hypothetical protein